MNMQKSFRFFLLGCLWLFNFYGFKAFASSETNPPPSECRISFSIIHNTQDPSLGANSPLSAKNTYQHEDLVVTTELNLPAKPEIEEGLSAKIQNKLSTVATTAARSLKESQDRLLLANRMKEMQNELKETFPQILNEPLDFDLIPEARDFLKRLKKNSGINTLGKLVAWKIEKLPQGHTGISGPRQIRSFQKGVILGMKIAKEFPRTAEEAAAGQTTEIPKRILKELNEPLDFDLFTPRTNDILRDNGINSFGQLAMLTTKKDFKGIGLTHNAYSTWNKTHLFRQGLIYGMKVVGKYSKAAEEEAAGQTTEIPNRILPDSHIDSLNLPDKIRHILEKEGITDVGDLARMTEEELLIIHSELELVQIKDELAEAGFNLSMTITDMYWKQEMEETAKQDPLGFTPADKEVEETIKQDPEEFSSANTEAENTSQPEANADDITSKHSLAEASHPQAKTESEPKTLLFPYELFIDLSLFEFKNANSYNRKHSVLTAFHKAGIKYIGDLVTKTEYEILQIKGVKEVTVSTLNDWILSGTGLSLGMKIENWPPSPEIRDQLAEELNVKLTQNRGANPFSIARDLTLSKGGEDLLLQSKLKQKPVAFSGVFLMPIGWSLEFNQNDSKWTESLIKIFNENEIVDLGSLVTKTSKEIRALPGVGDKHLDNIEHALNRLGLSLGMKIENWPLSPEDQGIMRFKIGQNLLAKSKSEQEQYKDIYAIIKDLLASDLGSEM